MPVKHCCYGCCKSDSRYPERMIGLHFIPFPKPKSQHEKCIRWIEACGRPQSQFNVGRVNKDTYICSKHFKYDSGPTEEYPDPVLYEETAVRKTRQPKKRTTDMHNVSASGKKQLILNHETKGTQTYNREYYALNVLAACVKVTELEDENKKLKETLRQVTNELEAYKNKEMKKDTDSC
ncbi:uncharacterized protein LOC117101283 [Anneissia japonica]|uniref:uncharacterized protein LOC117101283 n=1 Tax=Anneissia japonica TaxID=1529436 RepID=UPI001425B3B0|nr:uncharacterized protein LOC117101283 [Anneissia japonica]